MTFVSFFSGAVFATAIVAFTLPSAARPTSDIPAPERCEAYSEADLKSAIEGDARAQFLVGHAFVMGLCGPSDTAIEQGLSWLIRSSGSGDKHASFVLGKLYEQGDLVQPSEEQSMAYYKIAAEAGHPAAEHALGMRLLSRRASDEDLENALYWLGSAASHGDAFSAAVVGFLYARGMHGIRQQPCLALDWYEASELIGAPFPLDNFRAEVSALTVDEC